MTPAFDVRVPVSCQVLALTTTLLLAPAAAAVVAAQTPFVPISDVMATLGASTTERATVDRFYATRGGWAWTTAAGAFTVDAGDVRARLAGAARHGLDPAAYLTSAITAALEAPANGEAARQRRDIALTLAAVRLAHDLHLGRIDPRALGLRLPTWNEPHDFALLLAEAALRGDTGRALNGLTPRLPVYDALVNALARYRAIDSTTWPALVPVEAAVRSGEPYGGVPGLVARLVAYGDLASANEAAAAIADGRYDATLAAAVARFQTRHGLTADGGLGVRTLAALGVAPEARARQIVLALERLRWVPDLGQRRVVAVNIPMFELWGWEAGDVAAPPAISMDVIVGRALGHETPVFVEAMEAVVFRPYWNVPPSIVRDESLPAIRRNPQYLARQAMEIVRGGGDDAAVVPADAEAIAALARGTLRLRQRPGPANALGLVKFVFPNQEGVYMHGTPTPALFSRDRRDFSHGCIRVADPPALAAWALAGVPAWPPARIAAAMAGSQTIRVALDAPIDVVLFYLTASVGPADGQLHFADDIYRHDATLARALGLPR